MIILKKKWYCVLLIFLSIVACQNRLKDSGDATLVIEKTDFKKQHKLSAVFEDIVLIPLETHDSCLIGACSKIIVTDSIIYVLDTKSNQLFCFNKQGKFMHKIGEIGRGPEEYLRLNDFCVLKNGNVAILDEYPNKLIIYNIQGEVLTVQKLPLCADALECLNDSVFVFNGSCFDDPVILWNYHQQKKINSFLKYDERFCGRILKPFIKSGSELLWSREYHQELFRVEENELVSARKIDFGEYRFTGEVTKRFMGLYFPPPHVANMYYYTETTDYIVFYFMCTVQSEQAFLTIHSKESKSNIILNADYFTDDLTYYCFLPHIVTDTPDGKLVGVLQTSVWFNHLEELEKNKQYEPESFNALKEKLKDVQFSDNPVIAIYHLKPF